MKGMAKNQKSYTPEFKQQTVDLYNAGGTPYPQLEREYGVNRSTVSGWVKQLSPIKVSEGETVTPKEYKALPKKKSSALRPRMKYYTKGGQSQKSDRHIRKRTIAEIVAFIQNNLTNYSVSQLCSALKFPRSTYYKALVCVPSNKRMEYEEFGRKVKQAFEDSKRRYGAVKLCHVLGGAGTPCSIKRAQRHMAEQGLRSVAVKKYSHHANHGSIPDGKVNILERDFGTETINQKWCTDITYIHVQKEGWTYLASVMDLCSRKIIGHAYGTSMTAELAVEAVGNACLNVRDTKGGILHSDLGSQYTSRAFEDCLARKEILHSFSRKGNPYDNACMESFHSVLKKEEIYLHTYQDSKEARRAVFEYIEGWYNRKRIHSPIGYLTPQ